MKRVLVVAAALAVTPAAPAAGTNACRLLTPAETAKAIFVKRVAPGTHLASGPWDSCTYKGKPITVIVETRPLPKPAYAQAVHAIKGPSVQAGNVSPNAWVSFVPNGIALIAWQRGTELMVRVTGAESNGSIFVATIAKLALARL